MDGGSVDGFGREDFERNGLGHLVTVYHADVCQKKEERGTGTMATVASQLAGKVDAVSGSCWEEQACSSRLVWGRRGAFSL